MKLAALFVFFALPFAHAETMRLHQLNCRAVNGGTLKATGENGGALLVEGSFGFSQKQYLGRIDELNQDSESRFLLLNREGGVELEVLATIDPEDSGVQTVSAQIGFANMPWMSVSATCHIQVNTLR